MKTYVNLIYCNIIVLDNNRTKLEMFIGLKYFFLSRCFADYCIFYPCFHMKKMFILVDSNAYNCRPM